MQNNEIDDSGPAFSVCFEGGKNNGDSPYFHEGVSLRDHFAGQALCGLYACRDLQLSVLLDMAKTGSGDFASCMAKQAYLQADAMIAAREASGSPDEIKPGSMEAFLTGASVA